MKAPDRYSNGGYGPYQEMPDPQVPPTPTVYPFDDHVKEGLLGADGKPMNEGTKRKHPIGFHRQVKL